MGILDAISKLGPYKKCPDCKSGNNAFKIKGDKIKYTCFECGKEIEI